MQTDQHTHWLLRFNRWLYWLWCWLIGLLILRVLWGIVANYPGYFPADFQSHFLIGRESSFRGLYRVAFYLHIISSPLSILFGMGLVSDSMRKRWPRLHRIVGRVQIAIVVLAVTPSGLIMSAQALGGTISVLAFATLSIVTGACAVQGFRYALRRDFSAHRRWMWRTFVLLCSAIVLRLLYLLSDRLPLDPVNAYRMNAWLCWVAPLLVLELIFALDRYSRMFSSNFHDC